MGVVMSLETIEFWYWWVAAIVFVVIEIRLAPTNPTYRRQLAASYAMMDRIDEAQAAIKEYLRLEPNHTVADSRKVPTKIPEHLERFLDGLRKAGLPE